MAASRQIQARVPGEIQDAADKVLQEAGLTISDVVRVLMTRIARDKAVPSALFQPQPNAITLAAIEEARAGGGETVTLDQIRAEIQAAQVGQ